MPEIGKSLYGETNCSRKRALAFLGDFRKQLSEAKSYSVLDVRLLGCMCGSNTIANARYLPGDPEVEMTQERRVILETLCEEAESHVKQLHRVSLILCFDEARWDF